MRDSTSRITAVIGDDHPMFREGVVRTLETSGRVHVLAQAHDGRSALEAIQEHRPQIAVLDYRMPELDGAQVAAAVQRDHLLTRVLLLSAHTDSAIVYHALQQGAHGFLPKETGPAELVAAVEDCAHGRNVVPPALAASLVTEIRQQAPAERPTLSERERQVLSLIAEGRSIPAMAKELFLAPSTVKTHVQNLYEKLGVNDRGSAVAEAMRRGLLE